MSAFSDTIRKKVDDALDQYLPSSDTLPDTLHKAMRYVVFNGGKRIRPLLVFAVGDLFQLSEKQLMPLACAIELIHAYSLTHDDLPAMDDDDWRRGKPSCHKAFDEATAILAGDALQALAFELILQNNDVWGADITVRILQLLTEAVGSQGMVGGQAMDLEGKVKTKEDLLTIYALKTGALFSVAINMVAATVPDLTQEQQKALETFGNAFGLAFQLYDDIDDQTQDAETITYLNFTSQEDLKRYLQELLLEAGKALAVFGQSADKLRALLGAIAP